MDHLLTSRKASRKDHPSGAGHTARGRRDLPRRTRVPPKSCARPRCPHAQPHRSSSFHHLPCCLSSSFSEQYGVQRNRGQLTNNPKSWVAEQWGEVMSDRVIAPWELADAGLDTVAGGRVGTAFQVDLPGYGTLTATTFGNGNVSKADAIDHSQTDQVFPGIGTAT